VRFIDVLVGTGDEAQRSKCVYTRYIGRLATGKVIDFVLDTTADGKPKDPFGFVIGQHKVIPGWEIGVEGMRAGGYRRLLIPWRLGYGAGGNPPRVPRRMDLVFDVQLVKVVPSRVGGTLTTPTLECGPWRG
jgi:peptidylprolyl isomerase